MFDNISSKIGYHRDLVVGELDQTIGEDIGLLEPIVSLSNEFLSVDCTTRRLVKRPTSPTISSVSIPISLVLNGCCLWALGRVNGKDEPLVQLIQTTTLSLSRAFTLRVIL